MPISKLPPATWRKNVPKALTLPHWVAHYKKVPSHPVTRMHARVNDPATWGTLDEVNTYLEENEDDPGAGAGYVYTEEDGIVAIDLDHMVEINPGTRALKWLPGSEPVRALLRGKTFYGEVSPSGTGVHIFVKGRLPPGVNHKRVLDAATGMRLEVWDHARYVTLTGNHIGAPDITECPPLLEAVVEFVGVHDAPAPTAAEPERLPEIERALSFLDPDCDYEEWIRLGMALRAGLGAAGKRLFIEWSAKGSKYVKGEPETKWDTFSGSGVGLGTIVQRAKAQGWEGPHRDTPSEAFADYMKEDATANSPPGEKKDPLAGRIVVASELVPENIDWLWKGRIAIGMLWLVVGEPGQGKSLFVTDAAARITRGLPLPGEPRGRRPGRVVVLNAEDHAAAVVRTRLDAAGCDLSRAVILTTGGQPFRLPSEVGWLYEIVRRYKDADFLVLDPLATVLDPKLDQNSMGDVRKALDPLSVFGAKTKVSPGVVHHFNKATDRNGIHRIAGSVGITAASRYVLVVGPDPEDEENAVRHVGVLKTNGAVVPTLQFTIREKSLPGITDPVPYIEWTGASKMSARALTETPQRRNTTPKREDAALWLAERLGENEVPTKLLFEEGAARGYIERTLRRAAETLGVTYRSLGKAGATWKKT